MIVDQVKLDEVGRLLAAAAAWRGPAHLALADPNRVLPCARRGILPLHEHPEALYTSLLILLLLPLSRSCAPRAC